jgi:hypothetical protein
MSRERSVIGTVLVTAFVTSAVLVAGWFGASRYLGQQAISPAHEDVAATTPAHRPRTPRVRKSDNNRGGPQDGGASTNAAPSGALAEDEGSGVDQDVQASSTPPAETEPASESPAPIEAVVAPPSSESQEDARTIMEEAQRRAVANFYRYEGLLQSFDTKNKVTEKRWTFDREGSNGKSKSVLRFTAPAEVKGVALLIYNHPERASDQWMWTPALERDRRIALQDRSTRFFGTDFSFEDLEERDVDQYDYAMLGNDTIEGAGCWKIQMTPKRSRSSHYTSSIAWVRKDNYVLARLDNFVKDEVVKRLTNSTIENIQGIWTARQLEMTDLHRGTRTRLTLQQIKYNVAMKEEDFTLDAIRR